MTTKFCRHIDILPGHDHHYSRLQKCIRWCNEGKLKDLSALLTDNWLRLYKKPNECTCTQLWFSQSKSLLIELKEFFLNREKSMNLILIPYACKAKHIRNSVKNNDREF